MNANIRITTAGAFGGKHELLQNGHGRVNLKDMVYKINIMCMISPTRHTHNAAAAVTSQTNKRHVVAVKQLILVMLVYIVSFVPMLLSMNLSGKSVWIVYLVYINNVANFFIYLAVNMDFRNETKVMINMILKKVRPTKEQNVFVLS